MPSAVRAVLFDYGLVLTGPPSPAAWAQMRAITGLDEAALHAAYWAHRHAYDRGTHTGAGYWRAVAEQARITLADAQIRSLIAADTALWTQPNPPMIAWAARLQAAGTPTGILSNLGDSMTAGIHASFPWLDAFPFRLFSHTLKLAKPEPSIYEAAIAGLDLPAANILFIDDREDNVLAARAVGMQAMQYLEHDAFVASLEANGLGPLWHAGADGPA